MVINIPRMEKKKGITLLKITKTIITTNELDDKKVVIGLPGVDGDGLPRNPEST